MKVPIPIISINIATIIIFFFINYSFINDGDDVRGDDDFLL